MEYRGQRQHPDRHDDALKLGRQVLQLARGGFKIAELKSGQIRILGDHGLRGDKLAHEVQQAVQLVDVDADKVLSDDALLAGRDRAGLRRAFGRGLMGAQLFGQLVIVVFKGDHAGIPDISPFLDGSQLAIKVSFDMEIEGVLHSELMQIMSIDTGRKMAKAMLGASAGTQNTPGEGAGKTEEPPRRENGRPDHGAPAAGPSGGKEKAPSGQVSVKPATYEAFEGAEPKRAEAANGAAIDLIGNIPLQVSVELGKTKRSINDILNMGIGSVVVLDKMAGELVEVIVNGKRIARGEVVVIDENYGVRITDIVSRDESA